jgi:hypothetical protein
MAPWMWGASAEKTSREIHGAIADGRPASRLRVACTTGPVRWALIVAAYAVATAIMTAPIFNFAELSSANYEGDARLIIWTLAWDNHAVLERLPLFESNTYYPAADSLAYNEHLFGLSLFTLPVYAATHNPVLAYNVVWLLAFLLSGVVTHAFVRRYVSNDLAAFTGSMIFTFSFYKMLHAHGHLQHIWTWLLPASALCLERWFERPTISRATAWAATVALQALTSWYLAVFTLILQAILLLDVTVRSIRRQTIRQCWQLAATTVLVAGVLWPFASHYGSLGRTNPGEAAMYSADAAAYLVPPADTWLGKAWTARGFAESRWIWGERTLFLGWTALALGLIGAIDVVWHRKWRIAWIYGGLVIVALALSFGPSVDSRPSGTLFDTLSWLPGFGSLRAPARFAVLVLLGLAVFAGIGADRVIQPGLAGRTTVLLLLPFLLSEYYLLQFPSGKPRPFPVPPIYRAPQLQNARALVSLPTYHRAPQWFLELDYPYYSTAHWRPIVNGGGRSAPPGYLELLDRINTFPSPSSAAALREVGVDHVVLHTARYPSGAAELVQAARNSSDFRLVARAGSDYLFAVLPLP